MALNADLFAEAADPERVISSAVEALGRSLEVSRAFFGKVNALGTVDIVMDWRDGSESAGFIEALSVESPLYERMICDGVVTVDDVESADIEPHLRDALRRSQVRALMVSVRKEDDRPASLMGVAHHEPRSFDQTDMSLLRQVFESTHKTLSYAVTLERLRNEQGKLQSVSSRFEREPDPDAMLHMAAEMLGRTIGVTRAFYGEIDADADTIDIIMDWTDGIPSVRGKFPFSIASQPVQNMLRTGVTVVEDMDKVEMPQSLRDVNRANDTLAWIAIPLIRAGKPVALISVTNSVPRSFTSADVDLVREIGERTWQALLHAKTSRSLCEYQAAIDARAGHERFFRALVDEIRDDRDDVTVLFKVATMLAEHLKGSSASFSEPCRTVPATYRVYHHVARPAPLQTVHDIAVTAASLSALETLRSGRPIVSRGDCDDDLIDVSALFVELQPGDFIVMPVVESGEVAMMLTLQADTAREWGEDDVQLVRDLTERAWSSVSRIRAATALAERERNQALLIAWNDAVRDEVDPERVMVETLSRLDAAFGFLNASFSELDANGSVVKQVCYLQDGELRYQPISVKIGEIERSALFGPDGERTLAVEDVLTDMPLPEPLQAVYCGGDTAAFLVAPVFEGGRLAALLALQSEQARRWTGSERQVLRDLADRVWSTVTRVRTERLLAEREATQALLIEWSDIVRDETDPEQVIAATLNLLGCRFGLRSVTFCEMGPSKTLLENVRTWQKGETFREARSISLSSIGGILASTLLDGKPILIESVEHDERISSKTREAIRQRDIGALAAAPIVDQSHVVALLAMQSAEPRRWSVGEQSVLRDLVDRLWSKVERTRSEIELSRSRRALGQSEKMASMGAVLAGISHELNNPLAIVTAQAQLIAHVADGTELAERAKRVHEAGDRCARIIHSFLAMARQTPPERRRAEIGYIVERAIHQVAPAMTEAEIVFRAVIDPNLPDVSVDADQIHQLLVNLLVNAHQSVAQQRAIDRLITVRVASDAQSIHVEVADSGAGIPEAVRERIFEPFFTTKPTGYGTGMGLALSQGLAELHGGALSLMPSDRGAVFRLTLPFA